MKHLLKIKTILNKFGFITYPILIVISGWLIFYNFPHPIFSDKLNIKNYPKIYELFSLIISSLVSLIGIYISVSLVAYEFFKQKSGIDFHKSFLVNRVNAYYISFSVLTIIFTFFCSLTISSTSPNYKEISVIYYNSILFVFVIACLFPVAFNLFSSFKPEKMAHDAIQKINNKSIFIEQAQNDEIDKQAELIENDYLIKVTNIVIALIAVSDNFKAQAIIHKTTLKLSNLIIDETNLQDKEYIIERLISFYIKIIDFSLLHPNNTVILKSIWVAVDKMYTLIIERKETVEHYAKFHKQFFERYFNRLLESNKEEIIFDGITTIRYIIQNQVLLNMADDSQIYNLNHFRASIEKDYKEPVDYTDENFKNSRQWSEIAIETMNSFTFLINKGIKLNKPDLINKCFEQINKLNFKIHFKKNDIYKQCYFFINSANIVCDYAYTAFEKNVFIEGHDAQYLMLSFLDNLIEEKHPAARTVLQKYCYFLINIQQINKLDRWFLGGLSIGNLITTQGDLGKIAWVCAKSYNKGKEFQDCLSDCISAYKIMKEYYELKLSENFRLYNVIKWQFQSILEELEKVKISNDELITELKELIASFKNLDA